MRRMYFETLFSPEYFPYWEFSMLMMLVLVISLLIRLIRIEKLLKNSISTGSNNKGRGLIAGYKPNLLSKYLVLNLAGRNDEMIEQMWKDMEKYKE